MTDAMSESHDPEYTAPDSFGDGEALFEVAVHEAAAANITPKVFRIIDLDDRELVITQAGIATDVKALLQTVELSPLQRNTNEVSAVRAQSVQLIFEGLGMLPSDTLSFAQFTASYKKLENELSKQGNLATTEVVMELLEEFENHPVVKTVDMLTRTATVSDSVVHIRRMTTLLLAEHLPRDNQLP